MSRIRLHSIATIFTIIVAAVYLSLRDITLLFAKLPYPWGLICNISLKAFMLEQLIAGFIMLTQTMIDEANDEHGED